MRKNETRRLLILKALYDFTGANTRRWACLKQIAKTVNIKGKDFVAVYDYLLAEDLIELYGAGYTCMITHAGIKLIEAKLDDDEIINGTI